MAPPELLVWTPASPGRWPFAGHVRGRWTKDGLALGWTARIAVGAGPVEGWAAAEALRDALAEAWSAPVEAHTTTRPWIEPSWAALGTAEAVGAALSRLDPALRERRDLSLLVAMRDDRGLWLLGFGWSQVLIVSPGGFVPAAVAGCPLLGDPGLPDGPLVLVPPHRTGFHLLALPPGVGAPTGDLAVACGVHP